MVEAATRFLIFSVLCAGITEAAIATECADLSGVWRMADVNPSRQYIASITPGDLHRYRLSKDFVAGSYTVTCQSGACMHQLNSTLRVVVKPTMNGTVALRPLSPGPPDSTCKLVLGRDWFLGRVGREHYEITEGKSNENSSAFTVKCIPGPGSRCSSWQTATGKLDFETQTATVIFNSGRSQSGILTSDCKRIYWCTQIDDCTNVWCEKEECSQPAPINMDGVVSIHDDCHAIFWADPGGTDGGTAGGDAWFREVEKPPTNLTVHIIPHSHLDPGWLQTVEAMYEGKDGFHNSHDKGPNSPAAAKGIQALITQMIAGVAAGKDRTFAPEIGVFYDMWWKDANTTQRNTVRQLVREGRLEWTGGGWTQHDEACSRIEDQVDKIIRIELFSTFLTAVFHSNDLNLASSSLG